MVKMIKRSEKIVQLKEKVLELENSYRRTLADYQNQERRFKDQQSQVVSMANATLIEKLLFPLDSLEKAQDHLKDKGLQMIIDQINSIFVQEGLEEIKTEGQEFDPYTMDCSEIVPGEKNLVVDTISKGYLLSGKVLRPAKVKVGSGSVPGKPESNQ